MITFQSTGIPVTDRAKTLLEQMPNVSLEQVQDWYISQLHIGDTTIIAFLEARNKEKKEMFRNI